MKQEGFLQLIIVFALFIVILSLLGVSLSGVFQNDLVRDNFSFVWVWSNFIWKNYLQTPAKFIWSEIIIDVVWVPFKEAFKLLREGENPIIQEGARI